MSTHFPLFPGPGTAPSDLLPTEAEKAALDASTAPDASNPFVTHGPAGDLTNPELAALKAGAANIPTTNQKGSLDATGPALDGTNAIVTFGATGMFSIAQTAALQALTFDQLTGIGANTDLAAANPVAARGELLAMAITLDTSPGGGAATWATLRTDLSNGTHQAVLVYFNTGTFEVVQGSINAPDGVITFTSTTTFSGGGSMVAFLFAGTALGAINVA